MAITFGSTASAGSISSSTGSVEMYNNSFFNSAATGNIVNSGQVLQTVWKRVDTKTSWSVTNSGNIITDMNISITPRYSTSKILVWFSPSYEITENATWRLGRNGSEIVRNSVYPSSIFSGWANVQYDSDNNSTPYTNTYWYIDSPNTTATTTYNLICGSSATGAVLTLFLNYTIGSTGTTNYEAGVSFAMLQEIA